MKRIILAIAVACLAPSAEARAADTPAVVDSGMAREIVDGDTLVLATGTQVRLVGIQAPKLPLGRPGFRAWPLAAEAKATLSVLVLDKPLRLSYGGRKIDRHGRLLAHVHTADGAWVQGRLLDAGMARVYTFADNRSKVREMLTLEARARRARRGIWSHRYYRVLRPAEAARFIDTFQLVEGRVLDAAVVRRRGYLNFGRDWRSDFTISVSPRHRRTFRRSGVEIADYRDKRVRVRGWLKSFNGPMIEATHPEQIEVLDP